MRIYDEIAADARGDSPFSNSTQWEIWMENWCTNCSNDPDDPDEIWKGKGCPIVGAAVVTRRTPVEWLEQPPNDAGDWFHCVEFRGPDDGPGEPQPIPDPPGQPGLFPREPYEGTRMYADSVPQHQEVR